MSTYPQKMVNEPYVVKENTTDWKINLTMIYFDKSQNSNLQIH